MNMSLSDEIFSNASFRSTLLSEIAEGVLVYDRDFKPLLWNPVMEKISGVQASQVLGRSLWECFPFLKEIGEDKYLELALQGATAATRSRPFHVPCGTAGYFDADYRPYRADSGEVAGGIAIVREVTARVLNGVGMPVGEPVCFDTACKYDELSTCLGNVIQQRRKVLNLSQEELACAARLHRTFISDVERGARNISTRTLTKIACALNMRVWVLLAAAESQLDSPTPPAGT